MSRYLIKRTLLVIPIVWGAMTLLFLVFFVVPGDPVQQMVGERAVNTQTRINIEQRLGLDKPWYVQYEKYVVRTAHFDLGTSFKQGRSVNAVLKQTAPPSLRLAFWAILLEVIVGVATGVISAVRKYSAIDVITTVSTTMVVAVPVFVLGFLFQFALGIYPFRHHLPAWIHFPVQGIGPNTWTLGVIPTGHEWKYLLLPAITLASVSTAIVARMMRSTMLEVMEADYMRTAAAKGLSRRAVILKHGMKNAMIPVVTLIGLDLASLIGSAILTETVYNWPGMGTEVERAINGLDSPVVLGLTIVLVAAYVVINLLVDLSYAFFDPRIRFGGEHK